MEKIGRQMIDIAQAAVPSVSAQEVHQRSSAAETIMILDVREPDEWAQGHIEGALLLSRGRIEGRIEDLIPNRNECIVAH